MRGQVGRDIKANVSIVRMHTQVRRAASSTSGTGSAQRRLQLPDSLTSLSTTHSKLITNYRIVRKSHGLINHDVCRLPSWGASQIKAHTLRCFVMQLHTFDVCQYRSLLLVLTANIFRCPSIQRLSKSSKSTPNTFPSNSEKNCPALLSFPIPLRE
jgi:hypothetical protein